MTGCNRRELGRMALRTAGSLVLAGGPEGLLGGSRPNSNFHGVQIGIQSYSFRDRPLDEALDAIVACGINSCELASMHVEPRTAARDAKARKELRQWRLTVSLDEFRKIREKFQTAGVALSAYNLSFRDDFSDEEIERGFQMAQALWVRAMTASANVGTAPRIDRYARQYKIRVGMHNHSQLCPNEFATPEDFAAAMRGASRYIAINLDIGHFTAAGFDPVSFLEQHHSEIVTLHLKDRKKNQGANVAWGKGDTPIGQILQLLKKHRYPIPANIEYEYPGGDTIEEMKKCLAYCQQALA